MNSENKHGPLDDGDNGDERPFENEAPIRETDENTEAPEEFEVDDANDENDDDDVPGDEDVD